MDTLTKFLRSFQMAHHHLLAPEGFLQPLVETQYEWQSQLARPW